MSKNQCTSSEEGTTFTTFDFTLKDNRPPLPPDQVRHNEIKRELRNIASSIDGLCIVMFIIGFIILFKGCG